MEATKQAVRCGVCKRPELEGENFASCSFCGHPFCFSHMAFHQLSCPSNPNRKVKFDVSFPLSAARKAASVLVTILILGSLFAFVTYPGATQAVEEAIGNAASYPYELFVTAGLAAMTLASYFLVKRRGRRTLSATHPRP